jgi:hypothetical protein
MDDNIQYGITEDYFDAVLASDGIAVRMSDNVAHILTQLVVQLIRFLETGELEQQRQGIFRRGPTPTKVFNRMFPNAYRDTTESQAFHARHIVALRDSAAPRRVYARCATETAYVITHTDLDDWLITLGLARFLVQPRDAAMPDMTGTWINYMQERLVITVHPQLTTLMTNWEQPPRTIRRGP